MQDYIDKFRNWRARDHHRVLLLFVLMATLSLSTAGISIWVLYQAAITQQREALLERLENQAEMIKTGFQIQQKHDQKEHLDKDGKVLLDDLFKAYRTERGFRKTGEFVLGKRQGNDIIFLLPHRFPGSSTNREIAFGATLAEPMRRALKGLTGTVVGPDYRGVSVLAAYRLLGLENIGIVTKIDLNEIREPFLMASLIGIFIACVLIVVGMVVFRLVSDPLMANLKENIDSLAEAQRIAQIGNWERNLATGVNVRSDEVYRIYGVDPKNFGQTYQGFLDIIHPDECKMVVAAHEKAISERQPFSIDFRIIQPTGKIRFIHSNGKAIYGSDGNPEKLVGTVQDITSRKRSEKALKRSEEMFRALIEGSSLGMMVHRHFIPFLANDALTTMFGYESPSEILNLSSTLELFSAQERERVQEYHESRLIGDDAPDNYDCKALKKDGTEAWFNIRSYRIPWDDGWAICSTYFDVTNARNFRTQLEQEAKLKSLSDLTTGAAHELNQPLNIIRMAAESLLEVLPNMEGDTGYITTKMERISSQTDRAAAIIDHMRKFGQISVNENDVIGLSKTVRDLEGLLQEQLRATEITLILETIDDHCAIKAGQKQIELILVNLVKNARDAIISEVAAGAPIPGNALISVSMDYHPLASTVRLIVGDTGPGIDENVGKRIFEPFFTTREVGKGMGMGLAVTYGIVSDMGGEINFINTSEGATFTISLPCVEAKSIVTDDNLWSI